ncbi:hypothetical protein ASPWEDRAFT_107167 [Aspergillus wentii DTO 134E9]|uniref:Major facilitator superfamily (MFS) profile domain-containing protein n=1 Tax=Aspergillus wentii DTO 134E9 TaxID=1073089 RepID=A0A1L9RT08_ASPWE|nr:uncharacterized protein ASPWEDRAFT_107167 [Aspergillus wentii DTO 134E9]KAI9930774.1 hypothetical protein MW887_011531 [Aspergillus wentii]OJJ37947.1 hypothetical protein ASPWEDRAFT_107167 [Aspergillus wentii DTO 134E9]
MPSVELSHRRDIESPDGPKVPEPAIISRPGSSSGHSSSPESPPIEPKEDQPVQIVEECPDVGRIASWRGVMVLLVTSGSQFLDNVFMTGANIALSSIQKDFDVSSTNLQWMISAYTLTFGGFLLLAGVLSDRYGRKNILCIGLLWLSAWTLAIGFGKSFIEISVFRGLQGIGAAMTVPSAIGIISSYFVGPDRTRALSIYAASGAVGFCTGLIFGGFLSSSLGWRYIFRLAVILTALLGGVGAVVLPKDRLEGTTRAKLDYLGAALSTAGLILLSFVLSSGGVYGWSKAFIIALLVISCALLVIFTFLEKYISNPIMPLSLWKIRNFAGLWIAGFTVYGSYQTVIYYIVLMAQQVDNLSAGQTALRFLPMGACGFIVSLTTGKLVEVMNGKVLLVLGMTLSVLAPIPSCLSAGPESSFWTNVFPTSLLSVAGVSLAYVTATTTMLNSVPVNVKSLCGGMLNTAFQIGSGVALAISAAVTEAVDVKKGHDLSQQYATGLWCSAGLAGLGLLVSLFGVKNRGIGPSDKGDPLSLP